jgi:uncharacterized protein YdeI (YjbR/CyaY-like superfamily)
MLFFVVKSFLFNFHESMFMELYFTSRKEWRTWLETNHSASEGVWLIYYKKASGKPRIKYEDAVEEALCFGWIDGKIKKINEDYFIQRFTPRRPGSRWSKYNIDRVKRLVDNGMMKPEGLRAYEEVLRKPALAYDNRTDEDPAIPDDLLESLKNNRLAYDNFMKFSLSTRRLYIAWLCDAKRETTRQSRILKVVEFSEQNRKPGMM